MKPPEIHDLVKPLCWLLGKWGSLNVKLNRKLHLPYFCPPFKDDKPDTYCDLLTFSTISGISSVKYEAISWNSKSLFPHKLEVGHFMVHPDKKHISLLAAHNNGMAAVEKGSIKTNCLELCTSTVANADVIHKPMFAYSRSYSINNQGQLVYKLKMRTEDECELKEYVQIMYEKI
ncbi:peroxynitrite isomerase THAP4-like [Diabrotica virgifera virgifera]|uniref:THAP4-like heme-binding domain-containing protein n=1 Tax=Diabrotica virgifera virgifera TaxID=50390 RepID=A0ABM5KCU6_DIAVI|nr:peroxynitrite isomerase THAP4-like [Diabrotica virgifera virgifera]